MNPDPLRRLQSKLSVAFLAVAALVLASCGGGGATSTPGSVGGLQLLPAGANIYAGVPYTVNIVGGRKPYLVTSNEQTIIPLNFTTDENSFTFVAANPGVVDSGLSPEEVPRRAVIIEVRDSIGATSLNTYSVLQNFFTGYGQSYSSLCPTSGTGGAPQACSGSDTVIGLFPISNGALYGNRAYRFERVNGDFSFVVEPEGVVPQLVNTLNVNTDHTGRLFVRIRVANNAPTQFARYRVTDIATGATTELVFTILQSDPLDTITILPSNTITFTGRLGSQCGSGSADVFVTGGTPPYTATPTAGLAVSPSTVLASGDRLTILTAASLTPPCPTGTAVLVTDSRGATALITVTIAPGTGTAPTLAAAPLAVPSLACGASSTSTVVGGTGPLSVNSSHPRISAVISGNSLTMTRLTGDGVVAYPTSGTVVITDGATLLSIAITATPANCP